jgi:ATP diphosphatase
MTDIQSLIDIMAKLRDPNGGCPWDVKQNFSTVAPYTIEEAYEVADAIDRNDMPDLKDELGDLLLQVVFHARMAEEAGHFKFSDVVENICGNCRKSANGKKKTAVKTIAFYPAFPEVCRNGNAR